MPKDVEDGDCFGGKTMTDFESIRVSGSSFQEFSWSLTAALQALPSEPRKRLRGIEKNYFAWYGLDGMDQRMNDRTVAQIFAEYQPVDVKPLATGEVEGVRYELYDAPPPHPTDGEGTAAE
jgi:hypothetical protein